ncbi:lysis protein [Xenorhabdus sp. XENO-1]|uniref:lysis protein n=1 Tax=Xenorhabdus bovienii TaxID=40576 RepID=UPI0020CA72CB|nr:lysis protein [Xenorhabdus bovienii]MCP9269366.1 lysis protein [Xenorhabdus bovienii subsp. africana]
MSRKLKGMAAAVGLTLMGLALYSVYSVYTENGRLTGENQSLTTRLSEQTAINVEQQERIKALSEQDTKRRQELTNAKSEIDRLHADSVAHPERVYIKAKCPVPEAVAASGMADAATARPTDAAVRNYWLLRERFAELTQMTLGLQDYIKTQCR